MMHRWRIAYWTSSIFIAGVFFALASYAGHPAWFAIPVYIFILVFWHFTLYLWQRMKEEDARRKLTKLKETLDG